MPSASSQIVNFLNPDRCFWIAISIFASCVAYKAQCQLQTLKVRTRAAATRNAPQDDEAVFAALKAIQHVPEIKQMLSRSMDTALTVEILTALSESPNSRIRVLVPVVIRQKLASHSYMIHLAQCIEFRRRFDREIALRDLRLLIVPHTPPTDPGRGTARIDHNWSPVILDSLRDRYVLGAVVESLVNCLFSAVSEGQGESPTTVGHALFILSVLMQYYNYASELAIYHGLIDWMQLLRRRHDAKEGLLGWLGPYRRVFAQPRGGLLEYMQERVGSSTLYVGDATSRRTDSHDASMMRCIRTILRMPGGVESMVEAALFRSYEPPRDLPELDSEVEDEEYGEYEEYEEDEGDEKDEEDDEDEGDDEYEEDEDDEENDEDEGDEEDEEDERKQSAVLSVSNPVSGESQKEV